MRLFHLEGARGQAATVWPEQMAGIAISLGSCCCPAILLVELTG